MELNKASRSRGRIEIFLEPTELIVEREELIDGIKLIK